MHLLGEGGEEAAISPATPLVGAFHVFRNRPSFRAARFAACASLVSVSSLRRPAACSFRAALPFRGEGGRRLASVCLGFTYLYYRT